MPSISNTVFPKVISNTLEYTQYHLISTKYLTFQNLWTISAGFGKINDKQIEIALKNPKKIGHYIVLMVKFRHSLLKKFVTQLRKQEYWKTIRN